jgi:ATPase components of various ABC-type transport systems, contain duplicated ATPase
LTSLLSIEDLSIEFVSEYSTTSAVKNISFHINRGETLALVGESGSGKSVTSLSILQLLPSPPAKYATGRILFHTTNGVVDLLKVGRKEIRSIRGNQIGMIFQEPMSSLNPLMKCGEQVAEALRIHKKWNEKKIKSTVLEWFTNVELPSPETTYHKYPHQLSGGQKQRVMIAMAMCCEPSLLICDEPTTALDVTVQKRILEIIKKLQKEKNIAVLFISHDLGVVAEIADRVAIIYKGEIVEENNVKSIFQNPQHPYTKGLIACRPALHPKGFRLPTIDDYLSDRQENTSITTSTKKEERSLLLDVKHLTVRYPSKKNMVGQPIEFVTAVDDVSFQVFKGETLGLVGESGCGKTTIGKTLLGLIEPSAGSIQYKNNELTKLKGDALNKLRKEIQLVFQDPFSSLNPRIIIGDAIAEPLKVNQHASKKEQKSRVKELLLSVDLSEAMMNRYPHEFSGGQRQRIVIARALSPGPEFLVCDESVSALDVSVQAQVLNLLNDLKNRLGLTLLFISHDLAVVKYMCDRILIMKSGKIVESGDPEQVYAHPKTEYTHKLIASIPKV